MPYPSSIGFGAGAGFQLFTQSNGQSGVYANAATRDAYFASNPADLARLDENQFLIIKLLDNGSGEAAYQQRSAGTWLDVTSLVQGETGPAGATGNSFFFNSIAERDTFFSTSPNEQLLETDLPVVVNIGNKTAATFVWQGEDAPPLYDPSDWRTASVETSSGTLYLGESGTAINSGNETLGFITARGDKHYIHGVEYDDTGSEQPVFWNFGAVTNLTFTDVFDTTLASPQDVPFTATIISLVSALRIRPATSGSLRVQAWAGTDDTGPVVYDEDYTILPSDVGTIKELNLVNDFINVPGQQFLFRFTGVDLFGGVQTLPPYTGQTLIWLQVDIQIGTEFKYASFLSSQSVDSTAIPTFTSNSEPSLQSNSLLTYESGAAQSDLALRAAASGNARFYVRDSAGFNVGIIRTGVSDFVFQSFLGDLNIIADDDLNLTSSNGQVDIHGSSGVLARSTTSGVAPFRLYDSATGTPIAEVYSDSSSPEGVRTASAGAISVVIDTVTPSNSGIYQLHSATTANTPWEKIGEASGVTGPATSTVNAIPTFDVTDGESIRNNPLLRYASSASTSDLIVQAAATGPAQLEIRNAGNTIVGLLQNLGNAFNIEGVGGGGTTLGDPDGVTVASLNGPATIRGGAGVVIEDDFVISDASNNLTATMTVPATDKLTSITMRDSVSGDKITLSYDELTDQSLLDLDSNIQLIKNTGTTQLRLASDNINNQATITFIDALTFAQFLIETRPNDSKNIINSVNFDLEFQSGGSISHVVGGSEFVKFQSLNGGNTVRSFQVENLGTNGATVNFFASTQNPEGNIPANRGDYCFFKSTTDGQSALYIKENGADGTNTGWLDIISSSSGVEGPATSTVGAIPTFDVTDGTQIQDNPLLRYTTGVSDSTLTLQAPVGGFGQMFFNNGGGTSVGFIQNQGNQFVIEGVGGSGTSIGDPDGVSIASLNGSIDISGGLGVNLENDFLVDNTGNDLTVTMSVPATDKDVNLYFNDSLGVEKSSIRFIEASDTFRIEGTGAGSLLLGHSGAGDVDISAQAGSITLINNHAEFTLDPVAVATVTATGVNYSVTATLGEMTFNAGDTIRIDNPNNVDVIIKDNFRFHEDTGVTSAFEVDVPAANLTAAIRLRDESDNPHLNLIYNDSTNGCTISTINGSRLDIFADGILDLQSTSELELNSTTIMDVNAGTVFDLDAGGDININANGVNSDINIVADDNMSLSAGDFANFGAFQRFDFVCGQDGDQPIFDFANGNTQHNYFVYFQSPVGNVTGSEGDVLFRVQQANSNAYIHRGTTSNNTDWVGLINAAPIIFGASSVLSTTATRYLYPGYAESAAPTSALQMRIPRQGILRNLYVQQNVPAGNGNTITYTVRVNGVVTALAATIASTGNFTSNTANEIPVTEGQTIDIEVTKPLSVGTAPTEIVVTMDFIGTEQ